MKRLAIAGALTMALALGGGGLLAGPASAGVIKAQAGGGSGEFELAIDQVGSTTFLYEFEAEFGGAVSGGFSEEGIAQVNPYTGQFQFHGTGEIEGSFGGCVNGGESGSGESDFGSGSVLGGFLNAQLSAHGAFNLTMSIHAQAEEIGNNDAGGFLEYTAHWSCANH
jgi:hypothetical protein